MKLDRETDRKIYKSFTKTKVEKFTPLWVMENYSIHNEKWMAVRSKVKGNNLPDKCFKCDKVFKINESISLVCLKFVGNKLFCNKCIKELE